MSSIYLALSKHGCSFFPKFDLVLCNLEVLHEIQYNVFFDCNLEVVEEVTNEAITTSADNKKCESKKRNRVGFLSLV